MYQTFPLPPPGSFGAKLEELQTTLELAARPSGNVWVLILFLTIPPPPLVLFPKALLDEGTRGALSAG